MFRLKYNNGAFLQSYFISCFKYSVVTCRLLRHRLACPWSMFLSIAWRSNQERSVWKRWRLRWLCEYNCLVYPNKQKYYVSNISQLVLSNSSIAIALLYCVYKENQMGPPFKTCRYSHFVKTGNITSLNDLCLIQPYADDIQKVFIHNHKEGCGCENVN